MNSSLKRRAGRALVLAFAACAFTPTGMAAAERGDVLSIASGDTLAVANRDTTTIVRLAGIVVPKSCSPLGQRSLRALRQAIAREPVRYERVTGGRADSGDRTRGGTMVARVILADGSDASVRQLERGMAWMVRSGAIDRALADAEARARQDRAGVWQETASMTSDARKRLNACAGSRNANAGASEAGPAGSASVGPGAVDERVAGSGMRTNRSTTTSARLPDGSRTSTTASFTQPGRRSVNEARGTDGRRERSLSTSQLSPPEALARRDAVLQPASPHVRIEPAAATRAAPTRTATTPRFHYAPNGKKIPDPAAPPLPDPDTTEPRPRPTTD